MARIVAAAIFYKTCNIVEKDLPEAVLCTEIYQHKRVHYIVGLLILFVDTPDKHLYRILYSCWRPIEIFFY